jgi:hypothetical protein
MSLNPVKVAGTVTNLGEIRATNVDVTALFYDNNHKVVDSEDQYIFGDLNPNGIATFELKPIKNNENSDKIKVLH